MLEFLKKLFGGTKISPEQLKSAGTILDVRTVGEYKAGHVKGSVNIVLDTLGNKTVAIKKLKTPIAVVCKSGARAGRATSHLKSMGIDAFNAGGWASVAQMLK